MTLHADFLNKPLAHRGLHDLAAGRPENSTEAVRAAIAGGYGIEIDLQLSSDGVPMVFHDYDLGRLTGREGPVQMQSAADLAAITLTGGASGIPTLAQVLDLVAGRVPLLIEIKDQDGAMGPDTGTLERATAKALEGYSGPVAVMSFNPHAVAIMAEAAPNIPRGLVTSGYDPKRWAPLPPAVCDALRDIPDYDRTDSCFISHEAADLGRARVAELKGQGANILCWTIKSPAQETEARKVAQGITFEGYLA